MSDDVLKLIPKNPTLIPEPSAQQRAVQHLEALLPKGEMCQAETYDRVTFIDQGGNIEALICPACSRRLPLWNAPDAKANDEWWGSATEAIEDEPVESVQFTMPCCGATVPYMSLSFDWPAGFARFELSIWNPQIRTNLSPEQVVSLEEILGCGLTQIRAHY